MRAKKKIDLPRNRTAVATATTWSTNPYTSKSSRDILFQKKGLLIFACTNDATCFVGVTTIIVGSGNMMWRWRLRTYYCRRDLRTCSHPAGS